MGSTTIEEPLSPYFSIMIMADHVHSADNSEFSSIILHTVSGLMAVAVVDRLDLIQ